MGKPSLKTFSRVYWLLGTSSRRMLLVIEELSIEVHVPDERQSWTMITFLLYRIYTTFGFRCYEFAFCVRNDELKVNVIDSDRFFVFEIRIVLS